ncbi:MAG: hypothetical protein H0Z39_03785 [Peptococcaceae bacterium]|nr:hypothetical protein [Peptococcaceae bacterium]
MLTEWALSLSNLYQDSVLIFGLLVLVIVIGSSAALGAVNEILALLGRRHRETRTHRVEP